MKICCKTKENLILITFNGKKYYIEKDKFDYIINELENNSSAESFCSSDAEILDKLIKYDLLNEDFLDNLNKLW